MEHQHEEEAAAIKLQAHFRGMKARHLRQAKIREEKEREKAAISAIRARKQQAQLAKKKSVTFSTQ